MHHQGPEEKGTTNMTFFRKLRTQTLPLMGAKFKSKTHLLKGIVQPFELGDETTLIRSAVKY